jgi:UDPglucose 6-dehydrogenase
MREAPALVLIDLLTKAGCKVRGFDPVSIDECKRRIGDKIEYAENHYDALNGADVLFLATEWTEFRFPDWAKIKGMLKTPVIFDGRNIYDKNELLNEGFDYIGIGFECLRQ